VKTTAVFAGRVEELQALSRALSLSLSGEPRLVVVEGPPGVGSSALLEVFAERARQRDPAVAVAHVAAGTEHASTPFARAAHAATRIHLYDRVGGRRAAIGAARELLPEWLAAIPVVGQAIAAIVETYRTLRRRRRTLPSLEELGGDDATDAILAISARRPLVLLLDDFDRAGPEAFSQMEKLMRGWRAGHRLLVVAACRPAPAGRERPPLHRLLDSFTPDRFQKLRLAELWPREVAGWVGRRFPHVRIPPPFLEWLHESTGGHPRMIEEALDLLVIRGVIRFENRRWYIEEPETDVARMEIGEPGGGDTAELEGVSPAIVEVLGAASLLPEEFDGLALAGLLARDELDVEDRLAMAAHHGLVSVLGETTLPSGEISTRFRFTSGAVRAAVAARMPPAERASLGRRLAELPARG
jgi:predicted ATPase